MDNNKIKELLEAFIDKYSIKSIILFGSRADDDILEIGKEIVLYVAE